MEIHICHSRPYKRNRVCGQDEPKKTEILGKWNIWNGLSHHTAMITMIIGERRGRKLDMILFFYSGRLLYVQHDGIKREQLCIYRRDSSERQRLLQRLGRERRRMKRIP